MICMYVMNKPNKWEDYLHLVEFSYNNGYQASLKIIPFNPMSNLQPDIVDQLKFWKG
jgi:hypothetical protein